MCVGGGGGGGSVHVSRCMHVWMGKSVHVH